LVRLLSKEYILMVVVGNLVAIYPGYLLVTGWLHQFAYHIDLTFVTFLGAFLLSELMAFASIFVVVSKTAQANPAAILKYE
jgi:putative ABC transport system permease protein